MIFSASQARRSETSSKPLPFHLAAKQSWSPADSINCRHGELDRLLEKERTLE